MKNSVISSPTDAVKAPSASESRGGLLKVIRASAEAGTWETWQREGENFVPAIEPRGAEFTRAAFGWSCRDVVTLPVWVSEGGDSADMVALELEMRGLTRPGEAPAFVLDEVRRENERRLFAVHLLWKQNLVCAYPQAVTCEPGVRWLPVTPNALHFWREDGVIACAISGEKHVIYAESLRAADPSESDLHALQRVIQRLQFEDVIGPLEKLVFFGAIGGTFVDRAGAIFGLPSREVERLVPRLPAESRDLPTPDVLNWRKRRSGFDRLKLVSLLALGSLAILSLLAGFRIFQDYAELRHLQSELTAQTEEVGRLIAIARDWRIVESAVDPDFYPLDILRDCAAQLPEVGARLTVFSMSGNEVLLLGEAATHPAAFEFAENIKNAPTLARYSWEMPQPTLLPNNTASFQLRGLPIDHEIPQP